MRTQKFNFILLLCLVFTNEVISQNITLESLLESIFNPKSEVDNEKVVIDDILKKTKDCISYEGLFTIYQNKENGKSFIEIDTSHLNNEYIYFSYIENGVSDARMMKGQFRGSKIIKISKFYNKIDFTVENTKYYFDDSSALKNAEKSNINNPIIVSEEIIAYNSDKTKFLINADNIFLNESLQQIKTSGLNKQKTRYNKIRNYPDNTDIVVEYIFENKRPLIITEAITDSRNVKITLQHSLIKMPDDNFYSRFDDPRIGYFNTKQYDMTTMKQLNYRDVIHKWRLIKKNPEEEYSEPVKPITWWIENTTPLELREIIKEGVESWNIAFKEAGFINAIEVKIQPDTCEWEAGDIRYNVIRWTSSPNPAWGGLGPSFVNPRTGEILGSDIMLEWVYITNRINLDYLFNNRENSHYCNVSHESQMQNIIGESYINNFDLSEEMKKDMIKQSLYRLVLHEVGHTLGLNHNFKGSLLLSNDDLNNKDSVEEKGICASVMEYPAINITNNPDNQGLFYDVKPGPYDIWAIRYGYSQFQDNEKENLLRILNESTKKEHAFGNDADDMRSPGKGIDPEAMTNDLSDDPVLHSINRMQLINQLIKNLKKNYLFNNESYERLNRAYKTLLSSYFGSLDIISRQIGGVKVDRSFYGQETDMKPFTPVNKEKQKESLEAIRKYGFSDEFILNNNDLYPYLQDQRRGFNFKYTGEDPKLLEYIQSRQNRILSHLLNSNVLRRINNSTLYGNNYTITEYMIDLRNSVFQDDFNRDITIVRQNLQITYINKLIDMISAKTKHDNISKGSAYYNIMWIKKNLNTKSGNLSTKQHKQYLLYLIDSIEVK